MPAEPPKQPTAQYGVARFDQVRGIGAVPFNQEIHYMGFIAMMTPHQYLRLAASRTGAWIQIGGPNMPYIKSQIEAGSPIGSPFLNIDFKNDIPKVIGHDGRTRMEVLRELQGSMAVPVHIFPQGGDRARHMTEDKIAKFRDLAIPEKSSIERRGPHFGSAIWMKRELLPEEAYAGPTVGP